MSTDPYYDLIEDWFKNNQGFGDRFLNDPLFHVGVHLCVGFMESIDNAMERVGVDPEIRERALLAFLTDQAKQIREDDFAMQHVAKITEVPFPKLL